MRERERARERETEGEREGHCAPSFALLSAGSPASPRARSGLSALEGGREGEREKREKETQREKEKDSVRLRGPGRIKTGRQPPGQQSRNQRHRSMTLFRYVVPLCCACICTCACMHACMHACIIARPHQAKPKLCPIPTLCMPIGDVDPPPRVGKGRGPRGVGRSSGWVTPSGSAG